MLGQVWRYRARLGEEHSKLYILKADVVDDERVFHVYVYDVILAKPYAAAGLP